MFNNWIKKISKGDFYRYIRRVEVATFILIGILIAGCIWVLTKKINLSVPAKRINNYTFSIGKTFEDVVSKKRSHELLMDRKMKSVQLLKSIEAKDKQLIFMIDEAIPAHVETLRLIIAQQSIIELLLKSKSK
jgi:hypothetical protein